MCLPNSPFLSPYGGSPPIHVNCKMHHRPLNPGGHCHSWSSDPLDPRVYGSLGFSYQFIQKSTKIFKRPKIARIAPILTIFWPKTSQRRDLFFEKFSRHRFQKKFAKTSRNRRRLVAVVVVVVVVVVYPTCHLPYLSLKSKGGEPPDEDYQSRWERGGHPRDCLKKQ